MGKANRFNLKEIAASLNEVQENFAEINAQLACSRDDFTDDVKNNVIAAYAYLDKLLADEVDIFDTAGLKKMLELNHVIHFGPHTAKRLFHLRHIKETQERFFTNIRHVKRWYRKHADESSRKIAAELYVSILSQPQLYIEGNHRTGSLVANWILMRDGHAPFVLNVDNAVAYFEPSSEVKFSSRTNKFGLPKYKYHRKFEKFLKQYGDNRYVLKKK
jgi:hypothetical protein